MKESRKDVEPDSEEDQVRCSFDVLFYKPSKDELAGPLSAQIYVKSAGPDDTGHIFITRRCDWLLEFEQQIDQLQTELEAIRKKAKQRFAKDR